MFMKHLDWVKTDDMVRWVRPLAARRGPAFLTEPLTRLIQAHARRQPSPVGAGLPCDPADPLRGAARHAGGGPLLRGQVRRLAELALCRRGGRSYEQYLTGDPDFPDALILFQELRETGVPPVILVQEWLARDSALRLKAMKGLVALAAERGCGLTGALHQRPAGGHPAARRAVPAAHGHAHRRHGLRPEKAKTPLKPGQLVVLGGDKD